MSTSIPLWKKLLSYIQEVHIESTSSVFNPQLYVSIKNGRTMLSTDNAIYSYEDKYDNFGHALGKVNLRNNDRCLILGFGLGSIPYIVEKVYKKNLRYTGVELDEEVIYLASKYGINKLKSPIEIIQADAYQFVFNCTEKFDLIAMDVFESDYIPDKFETFEFLETLKRLLTNKGILLYNRLAHYQKDIEHSEYFFDNVFKKAFPLGDKLKIKGNLMLSSSPLNN